jgi:superfamily IV 4 TMS phage holin
LRKRGIPLWQRIPPSALKKLRAHRKNSSRFGGIDDPNLRLWLVITALMLLLAAAVVPGFKINGFLRALIGALVVSLVNLLLQALLQIWSEPPPTDIF